MPQQTLTPLPGQFSRGQQAPNPNPPQPPANTAQQIENIQYMQWTQDPVTQRVLKSLENLCLGQLRQAGKLALRPGVTQEELRTTIMKGAIVETIIERIMKNEFGNLL